MIHEEITRKIIAAFYKVYDTLGYGFLERVYENAMVIELNKNGLKNINQFPIKVFYGGQVVGNYIADVIVENKIIIEIKAINGLSNKDGKQLLNYLRATDKEIGLVLNFGNKPEIKRKIFENSNKKMTHGPTCRTNTD